MKPITPTTNGREIAMNNFYRVILCLLTAGLLTGFTYGFKNNPQTGKPDMVVTSVASGDLPIFGNASTAKRLTTGRTIGITGPITYTSPTFDGSGNVTAAATVTSQTGTGSTFAMDASPTFSGNVGIGTSGALGPLHIYPGAATDSLVLQVGEPGFPLTYGVRLRADSATGIYGWYGWAASSQSATPILTMNRVNNDVVIGGTVAAAGGSTNHATCWKAAGVLGYCSTVVAADGSCTCN